MSTAPQPLAQWLEQAGIPQHRLSPQQLGLLRGAFTFGQQQGDDYYSTRIIGHFLLHCGCGLKVAQIARLLHISRPTASRQQGLSSKQVIQQAHHRLDGRPYGKLLPRFAGPIAGFLFENPHASRADLLDFIDATFSIRVSRVALTKFLNKFGLDQATRQAAAAGTLVITKATAHPAAATATTAAAAAQPPDRQAVPPPAPLRTVPTVPVVAGGQPLPSPTPPFSGRAPSTPAPSC